LRQYPLFNEIINRCLIRQPLVDALGVVKDEVVGKLLVKECFVVNEIKVVIHELLLEGTVVTLDIGIDLGIARITSLVTGDI
jgi:hypothetical protein